MEVARIETNQSKFGLVEYIYEKTRNSLYPNLD